MSFNNNATIDPSREHECFRCQQIIDGTPQWKWQSDTDFEHSLFCVATQDLFLEMQFESRCQHFNLYSN